MRNREELLFHIKHYENQLNEAYLYLDIIEKGGLKGKNEAVDNIIEQISKHLKLVCFFTSCFLDVTSSLKGLIDCENNWEKKFYLKSGFVSIYEYVQTFGKHHEVVMELIKPDFPEFEFQYFELAKDLRRLKKVHQYDNLITKFRNKAGAHYDEDFIVYYENLKNVDNSASVKTISEFSDFLMRLIIFWSNLIDAFKEQTEKEMINN